MTTFKTAKLWPRQEVDENGNIIEYPDEPAITVELPDGFFDLTRLPPIEINEHRVPDEQMLYVEPTGDRGVSVFINEYVEESEAATDEEALRYLYDDMIGHQEDTTQYWHFNAASLSRMPNTPAYTLLATQHPGPESGNKDIDFVAVLFILIRLPQVKTDITINIDVPHHPGNYAKEDVDFSRAKHGPLVDAAEAIKQRILQTFEIKRWGLFE